MTSGPEVVSAPSAAVDAQAISRWLHETRTRGRRRSDVWDQLYRLYVAVFLVGAPMGWVIAQALDLAPTVSAGLAAARGADIAVWLPPLLAVVVVGGLRLGTWRGPVAMTDAEVAWLLAAPVPRVDLVRPRLARALAWGMAMGAGGGVALWVWLLSQTGAAALPSLGACLLATTATSLIALSGSWLVVVQPPMARGVLRATPVVLALLAVGVAVGAGGVLRWSGPWGWATAVVQRAAGVSVPGWPVALALLVGTTVLAAGWALRASTVPPVEELRRRAGIARAVGVGAFWVDLGAVTEARRRSVAHLLGRRRRRRPPLPSRPATALPWVTLMVLLRGPWLWGRVVVLTTVALGAAAVPVSAGEPEVASVLLWMVIVLACAHGVAGALLEPVKVEVAQRFAIRWLRAAPLRVVATHLVTCGVVVAAVLAGAAAASALVLGAPAGWVGVAAATAVLLAPSVTLAATYGALRDRPDMAAAMLMGEFGAGIYALQMSLGVIVALVATMPPTLALVSAALAGDGPAAALVPAILPALAADTVLALVVGRWLRDRL